MKERPILFTAPMVRAILEGRQTQTRRIVKPQPEFRGPEFEDDPPTAAFVNEAWQAGFIGIECPYGKPGDQLWCRETWAYIDNSDFGEPSYCEYRADTGNPMPGNWPEEHRHDSGSLRWKPSIHMPRKYSRINLEITAVRVERLQDISEADVAVEGLVVQIGGGTGSGPGYKWNGPGYCDGTSRDRAGAPTFHVATGRHGEYCSCRYGEPLKLTPARCAFRMLWESIHGPGAWDKNPWVWVVEFRRAS